MTIIASYAGCTNLDGTPCEDKVYDNVSYIKEGNGFIELVFETGKSTTLGAHYVKMHPITIIK